MAETWEMAERLQRVVWAMVEKIERQTDSSPGDWPGIEASLAMVREAAETLAKLETLPRKPGHASPRPGVSLGLVAYEAWFNSMAATGHAPALWRDLRDRERSAWERGAEAAYAAKGG